MAALAAAISALVTGCAGPTAPIGWLDSPGNESSAGQDVRLTPPQRRQLEALATTLLNPAEESDAEARRDAAGRLIALNLPRGTAILDEALRSGRPEVVLAVVEAMDSSAQPVEGLLEAAVLALPTASDETLAGLRLLLPRYGPQAMDLIASLAQDHDAPPAARTAAIRALGAFRSHASASRLVALLDDTHPTPPQVIAAACASLQQLTGLPYGSDAGLWQQWWLDHKDESIEDWLRITVQQLDRRVAELQQRLEQSQRANDRTAARLAETLRDLFLTLDLEEQQQRLPGLLGDDLPPVRRFALGRVERMLRDSERVPPPVQDSLAERLRDSSEAPALRLLAAGLLKDLDYQTTGDLVVSALADEADPQIAAGYLEILAEQPTPQGRDLLLQWLDDPAAGEAAADALWAMVTKGTHDDESGPAMRSAIRAAFQWRQTPAHARLLAGIGPQEDASLVEDLLDASDPALRGAVAEGLAWAGRLEPLLPRADDEAVYPFILRRLAQGPATLDTLASLAHLPAPEVHHPEWSQTIVDVAGQLLAADLLAADDLLASLEHVDPQLRATALARVADLPADAVTGQQRIALYARLAELRITLAEYQRAYELLRGVEQSPLPEELVQLMFRASVMSGHFEEAAALNADVLAWVRMFAELTALAKQDSQSVIALRDDIQQRFEGQLTGEAKSIFEAAREQLPQAVTNGTTEPESHE